MSEQKNIQRQWTVNFTKKIQEILGNPALTPLEKAEAIKNIEESKDAGLDSAGKILNDKFGGGPLLSKEVAKFVNEGRPRGVSGQKGTKKNDE